MYYKCQAYKLLVSWILPNLFLKINVIFTHPPCFRCQEIFKSNVTHCLWQYSYFILEFLRPQVKPSSPCSLLAFTTAQTLDSGSKSETCFASILCSVMKWGSKKVLSTPSASSQWELRRKGGLVRAGYKAPHTSSYTKHSHMPCMGGWTSLQM